jgi:hypothetical protein
MTTQGAVTEPHGFTPNPAFMVPGLDDSAWADTPTWAPKIQETIGGTPDPMRTGHLRTRDYAVHPADPPADFYLGAHGPGRDRMLRHGVEYQDAVGWTVPAPRAKPQAPNPRSVVQPETRPLQRQSPNTYTFTRPFDQGIARQLNGVHFSMADHRREYPIMGMQPVKRRRNTFRVEPAPWDSDIVDMPTGASGSPYAGAGPIQAVDVPSSRNWRL